MDVLPKTRLGAAALEEFVVQTTSKRLSFVGTIKLEIEMVEETPVAAVCPLPSDTGWAVIVTLASSQKRERIAARRQREIVLFFI